MKAVYKYLSILGILTVIAGTLYFLLIKAELIPFYTLFLAVIYMPLPFYSLLILKLLFKEEIGFNKFISIKQLNIRDFGKTLLIFTLWIVVLFVLTYFLGLINPEFFGKLVTTNEDFLVLLKNLAGEEITKSANLPPSPLLLIPIGYVAAIIAGLTINLIFALGEEIGWRGYLNYKLNEISFVKRHLLIGFIWGLWHAPIILQGYNYGLEYPVYGSLMFILFCMVFSLLFGKLIEHNSNALYAAALHGMFNGFAGIFILLLLNYNPFVGGAIGIVSIMAMLLSFGILVMVERFRFGKRV